MFQTCSLSAIPSTGACVFKMSSFTPCKLGSDYDKKVESWKSTGFKNMSWLQLREVLQEDPDPRFPPEVRDSLRTWQRVSKEEMQTRVMKGILLMVASHNAKQDLQKLPKRSRMKSNLRRLVTTFKQAAEKAGCHYKTLEKRFGDTSLPWIESAPRVALFRTLRRS